MNKVGLLILTLVLPFAALVSSASLAQDKLDSTIFSYDGKDFVRTKSTVTDKGKSVVSTKLDQSSPAYKALSAKQSYTGSATVFGKEYDANYAPLIGSDGKVTGALFVGMPK
jgi:methyl-accepting chemotaxis protein-2 (aspartate sensor receptor)